MFPKVIASYRQTNVVSYRQLSSNIILWERNVNACLCQTVPSLDHNVNILTFLPLLFPTLCSEKFHLNNFQET